MARGQDAEFVEFADSALPRLRRTAYLLCGDWHRAEDLAQEALVRLYRAWPRISRREGLMPYAHRTVVRLLVDQSRRPWRREVSHADAVGCETPSSDPSDQVDDRILLVKELQRIGARRRA
jgi:DNA-directed RNA polymerase specialized sigma24 family protein